VFQGQHEVPGQRHFFERLKSVERDFEAIKLAQPFPTETLVPQLVSQAIEELAPDRRFYKRPKFLATGWIVWSLIKIILALDDSKNMVIEVIFGSVFILLGIASFFAPMTPTKRTRLVAAILNQRLRDRRETCYCVEVLRLLGTAGTSYGDTPQLRRWLFATLPYLTESEAQALPEEARVVLRRWLTAFGTTDAERVVLLLVLASANDEKAHELARRYSKATSEAVREATKEFKE
jgi:hypothetical protein